MFALFFIIETQDSGVKLKQCLIMIYLFHKIYSMSLEESLQEQLNKLITKKSVSTLLNVNSHIEEVQQIIEKYQLFRNTSSTYSEEIKTSLKAIIQNYCQTLASIKFEHTKIGKIRQRIFQYLRIEDSSSSQEEELLTEQQLSQSVASNNKKIHRNIEIYKQRQKMLKMASNNQKSVNQNLGNSYIIISPHIFAQIVQALGDEEEYLASILCFTLNQPLQIEGVFFDGIKLSLMETKIKQIFRSILRTIDRGKMPDPEDSLTFISFGLQCIIMFNPRFRTDMINRNRQQVCYFVQYINKKAVLAQKLFFNQRQPHPIHTIKLPLQNQRTVMIPLPQLLEFDSHPK